MSTLFFRPAHPETGKLWDTWLYYRDGIHYLFYLANVGDNWDNISLATSPDGVHWTEAGPILQKGEAVIWMGTGSTWAAPGDTDPPAFQINFSEWRDRQVIGFATSPDLRHWTRVAHRFSPDERWYEADGRWDTIWTLPRPEGGLYGYWTATPKWGTHGKFGFGESVDGVTWTALPPPEVKELDGGDGEVGAIEKIGDRYYMLFGQSGSMLVLLADQPQGPFQPAAKNRALLGNRLWHTYYARFYPTPDGLLVNHHAITRGLADPFFRVTNRHKVVMGLLKRVRVDQDGNAAPGLVGRE